MDAKKNTRAVKAAHAAKAAVLSAVLSILLCSCDLLGGIIGSAGNFWASNFETNKDYRVTAVLLWEGIHCNVWVETSSGINVTQAWQIAEEYDNYIYPRMLEAFGIDDVEYKGEKFSNIMEFADWLGDQDGKLCILLLDIKDGYHPVTKRSYVAGYFWSGDLLGVDGSNGRDMIYIDTKPGLEKPENFKEAYKTFAHEMQHLMNYATSIARGRSNMDTWIDEGLSSAAEWVYSGEYSADRIDWFVKNGRDDNITKGLIDQGNNFFVWNNRRNESQYAVHDDYATVYLFFQWLRLQSQGTGIYRDIINSSKNNHEAVVSAMSKYSGFSSDWQTLLKTWLAANYINAGSGDYGYMNDLELKDVKIPFPSSINVNVSLAPGEGVYSIAKTVPNLTGQGENIRNAYLTSVLSDNYLPDSAMLTYNINTNWRIGAAELGKTTGVPVLSDKSALVHRRSAFSENQGPYRIDAGEMLRQKPMTFKGNFSD